MESNLQDNLESATLKRSAETQPEISTREQQFATAEAQLDGSPAKKPKMENGSSDTGQGEQQDRRKGVAPIKAEFLVHGLNAVSTPSGYDPPPNDRSKDRSKNKYQKKPKGQNTSRSFGSSRDTLQLCSSRALSSEFSPLDCRFGEKCKFEHDLRKYLSEGKRSDLSTFNGVCTVHEARGWCPFGWKCRFAGSHSTERETEDGRKELVLIEDETRKALVENGGAPDGEVGVVNVVSSQAKIDLERRRTKTPKSDAYLEWLAKHSADFDRRPTDSDEKKENGAQEPDIVMDDQEDTKTAHEENRARFTDPPLLPSEKRRIYYGPETPILAPLTTQGNLPFRRLCVSLGAQITWSEMAMGLPLLQGEKTEWALMKAHESELASPKFNPSNPSSVIAGYDNSKDLHFGAQIAANKPWLAVKATEVLTALCPHLRAIDLNCGCPIDLVVRSGAGSALLDNGGKLEKMLRGMNLVSGEVPITIKIRTGTRDNNPTAHKLVKRLVLGGQEALDAGEGAAGVAAVTLHGRSRQQRYTRSADWEYIGECAALIKQLQKEHDELADTARETDARYLANGGKVYFIGNGDVLSHVDYNTHLTGANVDSVMIGRGALVKPWIFEEVEAQQYLDKSSSQRLEYVERFAKFGLEHWGSDEVGVGNTRRFLLEWLSFSRRYVPLGLLEHLPPRMQDRPPRFRGRDDMETLMASDHYKDWIKISEMFLGPAHPNFRFEPKHKSNSYEIEAEG
ncbi:tRNA-dihydrouridine(47) synthase [NAD(P)(+)] [Patellaria atrata CBS 101060]|uniref:tRNA-dihydrouridine(47) synthase [NAD(P)(+)] n=1 Tax=Patellaria atrata CBS 101060 TaxID=1346257 RepID=A0A9P4SB73_9PEZI|nr:tRNA-dihydrouridine(47) synthase [NAD(P)(+)] [Patellaria atrata CBS 101060]